MKNSLIITDLDGEQELKPSDHLHKLISGVDNNNNVIIKLLSSQLLYDEIAVVFMHNNLAYIAIYKNTNNPILNISNLTGQSFFSKDLTLLHISSSENIRNL